MQRTPFPRWSILVGLALLLALVAACGGGATPTAAPKAEPTKAPAAAAPTAAPAQPTKAPEPTKPPAPTVAPTVAKPASYKIGFINHLTGDAAVYGQSMKKGTEVALDEINGAGGINGTKLEVVYEDDRLQAADAQTAFLKLVQTDKVPVIMGSGSSTLTLSLCPKAQESKVVLISSISTAPALKKCGPFFFAVMASDDAQGLEWANIAKSMNITEAAVMFLNNDYGNGVKDIFTAAFQKNGGKILISQGFEVGGTDFRTELAKVKAANPKTVFIVSHVKEGALIFKQAKEMGFKPQWITDTALQTKEVPELAGKDAVEGILALRSGSTETPEYKKFVEAFKKKFNEDPSIWSDYAYDTTKLVAAAIAKGGYTAEGIQKALKDVAESYVGPSGPKKFNEFNISQGVYELYTVKDGQWVKYEKK